MDGEVASVGELTNLSNMLADSMGFVPESYPSWGIVGNSGLEPSIAVSHSKHNQDEDSSNNYAIMPVLVDKECE